MIQLRSEIEKYQHYATSIDKGVFPEEASEILREFGIVKPE